MITLGDNSRRARSSPKLDLDLDLQLPTAWLVLISVSQAVAAAEKRSSKVRHTRLILLSSRCSDFNDTGPFVQSVCCVAYLPGFLQ